MMKKTTQKPTKTFQCAVSALIDGKRIDTIARIDAENTLRAKLMLEAMYGRGNVHGEPKETV